MDLSIKMETITEDQKLSVAKKLKKNVRHIDFKTTSYCPICNVMLWHWLLINEVFLLYCILVIFQ